VKRKFFWSHETEAEPGRPAGCAGGGSLAEYIAAGPLPLASALHYAVALAEALREVHSRSRVYAFLQPEGVAILDGHIRLVPGGPVPVSPYFSPEQVAGRDLDARSDIFSLGAVTYEMLSGDKAFPASTRTALRMEILSHEPTPLENVPPALARLVRQCLEKKPERRVQRLEILLAALKLQEIIAGPMQETSSVPRTRRRPGPSHR